MQKIRTKSRISNIDDVVKFTGDLASEINDPVYGQHQAFTPIKLNARLTSSNYFHCVTSLECNAFTAVSENRNSDYFCEVKCLLRDDSHPLFVCPQFIKMKLDTRIAFVKSIKLCIKCLQAAHCAKNCKLKYKCMARGRGKKHSKYIHQVNSVDFRDSQSTTSVKVHSTFTEGQSEQGYSACRQSNCTITYSFS